MVNEIFRASEWQRNANYKGRRIIKIRRKWTVFCHSDEGRISALMANEIVHALEWQRNANDKETRITKYAEKINGILSLWRRKSLTLFSRCFVIYVSLSLWRRKSLGTNVCGDSSCLRMTKKRELQRNANDKETWIIKELLCLKFDKKLLPSLIFSIQ